MHVASLMTFTHCMCQFMVYTLQRAQWFNHLSLEEMQKKIHKKKPQNAQSKNAPAFVFLENLGQQIFIRDLLTFSKYEFSSHKKYFFYGTNNTLIQ